MESIVFCLAAFAAVYAFTRRSLIGGVNAALTVGYFYGIVRANVPQTAAHFIFDAGIGGLYLGLYLRGLTPIQKLRIRKVRSWAVCLVVWPLLLFLVPVQDAMVQLVGLRATVWYVPFLLIGALLDDEQRFRLAIWLAGLNILALGFGVAEFNFGIERFYPHNAVTSLVYLQNDVLAEGRGALRIPGIFVQQATYSSAMVLTMPLLIGAWVQPGLTRRQKMVLTAGIVSGMLGIFLGASRSQALIFFAQLAALVSVAKVRLRQLLAFAAIAAVAGYWVYNEPRLQRFTQVDFNIVGDRVRGSVNESFLDALSKYPLGNGLGGGGTSIPYFLQDRLTNPVYMENEYGRILLELGIPGLILWVSFAITVVLSAPSERAGPWRTGWRLGRVTAALYFATGLLGTGLLTAIPNTCLLLFTTGWLCVPKMRPVRIYADESKPWIGVSAAR